MAVASYRSLLTTRAPDAALPDERVAASDAHRALCRHCAGALSHSDEFGECKRPFVRILVATDGSAHGDDAVELGIAMARLTVTPIVFLHAAMPWRGGRWLSRLCAAAEVSVDHGCLALAESTLDRARSFAMNAGVRFETRLAFDPRPDRAIRQAVRDTDCDLVVMGTRSGRLARRVGRQVDAPILTCGSGRVPDLRDMA